MKASDGEIPVMGAFQAHSDYKTAKETNISFIPGRALAPLYKTCENGPSCFNTENALKTCIFNKNCTLANTVDNFKSWPLDSAQDDPTALIKSQNRRRADRGGGTHEISEKL